MNKLMYLTQTLFEPDLGVMLNIANQEIKDGHTLAIAYCNGKGDFCFCNPTGSRVICTFCNYSRNKFMKKYLPSSIRTIPVTFDQKKDYGFQFENYLDIKNISFRGCSIGYAVMSTYISVTRNPEPVISKSSKKYFSKLLTQAAELTDIAYNLIEIHKPDQILIFNGRHFENRSFLNIGQKKNIPVSCYENIGSFRSNEDFSYMEYKDDIPQSLKIASQMIETMWNDTRYSIVEKKQKACDFYERRRNGIPAGDRVYIKHQKPLMLPSNWNYRKRNIVIFNSSEDEFASLNKDFSEINLFKSQLKAWDYLFSHIQDSDFHFYLRIHPNLEGISYAYHTDLYKLGQKYSNVTIISPLDKISSYTLLDAAEKIIVSGSTMGAEAAYANKPVILISASFYSSLNFCYKPQSQADFISMVRAVLSPKNKIDTLKYAYFILYRNTIAITPKYCDVSIKSLRLFNKTIFTSTYCKILGSCLLWKITRIAIQYLFRNFGRVKMPDPFYNGNHIINN